METKFPNFDSFACVGDTREVNVGDYRITATLHEDCDSRPDHYDCYDAADIQRWSNDEWRYVGIVLSVEFRGVMLAKNADSLWGVDCNFSKDSNTYLADAASGMISEAIANANVRLDSLLKAATALA